VVCRIPVDEEANSDDEIHERDKISCVDIYILR
jgi:hypothetical protein